MPDEPFCFTLRRASTIHNESLATTTGFNECLHLDHVYFTEKRTILEHLISSDAKGLRPIIEILLNEIIKFEREEAVKVAPYERNPERIGYANGFITGSI